MTRRLALRREALTELRGEDLALVAGAAYPTPLVRTIPLDVCLQSWGPTRNGATCDYC
jgi:hypothetical protein